MTYRIAFVRFNLSDENTYPVNCDRADIEAGVKVVVETPEQEKKFKIALVENVQFKNWNCKNSIICLHSEVQREPDGSWTANRDYLQNGQIHNVGQLQERLAAEGWKRYVPRQSTWRVAYSLQVGADTADILFRKNGIDLRASSQSVDHWYYLSEIDLFEFCWSFAKCWKTGKGDLGDFFIQKGRRFPKPSRSRNELGDIYDVMSGGSGGAAYLGDGIWIGPSGRTWDEHR